MNSLKHNPPHFHAEYGDDEAHQRGQLYGTGSNYSGIVAPPQQEEDFGYDATGNWATSDSLEPPNSQMRTHNQANEITAITNSTAPTEPPVQYDPAGNMTLAPETTTWGANYQLVYDAWNRLVQVLAGSSTVATYAYDGLTRRIQKMIDGDVEDFYYSKDWQVLEARSTEASSSSSEDMVEEVTRYSWGLRGVDDLIVRKQVVGDGSSQRLFALSDQWNVVAVTDQAAVVLERYGYNAFGTTLFMTLAFGDEAESLFGWETTFCGYRLDNETGFYQVRYRYLHPTLGRWLSRDPLASAEMRQGPNLYEYVRNAPVDRKDSRGLDPDDDKSLQAMKGLIDVMKVAWQQMKNGKCISDPCKVAMDSNTAFMCQCMKNSGGDIYTIALCLCHGTIDDEACQVTIINFLKPFTLDGKTIPTAEK